MLVAYDCETGERIHGGDADKNKEYVDALFNKKKVIPVQGDLKIHHFRYDKSVPTSDRLIDFCNESDMHEKVKQAVYELMCEYNHINSHYFNVEFRFKCGRIADVGGYNDKYVIAVEVVHKHLDFKDYMDKKMLYAHYGIHDFWIFTKEVFNWEKGYGKLFDIMDDLQKRFGCLYYFDEGDIMSLTMTRQHSPTQYFYDKSQVKFGYDFNKMACAEEEYQLSPLKETKHRLHTKKELMKSEIESMESEIEKLSKDNDKRYDFLMKDKKQKDMITLSLPTLKFEEDSEYIIRFEYKTRNPEYKNGFWLVVYYHGKHWKTQAHKQLQYCYRNHPHELIKIKYMGKDCLNNGYFEHQYMIRRVNESFYI